MNKYGLAFAFGILALHGGAIAASAGDLATATEARAMLDRASAALQANETTALQAFNDPGNQQFHDRDLYVFCFAMSDGKITAYSSPGLLGIDIRSLKLKDDPIGQRAYDAVQNVPEASVVTMDYMFPKPGTSQSVPKQSLETRIGNQGCAVAYFK